MSRFDVVIIGAGPTGLACAIECRAAGLKAVVLEKGCLVNSIYHFPANMVFFTTSDLLEIGGLPFTTTNAKPTREEGLNYYKRCVQHFALDVRTQRRVISMAKRNGEFVVKAVMDDQLSEDYTSSSVIVATGYYDNPNLLGVEGEDLPHVSHYYGDPHPFYDKEITVVGGKNSACIAALELYRYGSRVTVIHRGEEIKQSVKYWILPDFLNRVKEGSVHLMLNTVVQAIKATSIVVRNVKSGSVQEIKADHVFSLTGYHPDVDFLKSLGIRVDESMVPEHDPKTLESNVDGLYVAGSITVGMNTNKLFIENGRFHGKIIVEHLLGKRR